MLPQVYDHSVQTFRFNEKYLVDIIETPEIYEAWLFREDCGIKDFMFGNLRKDFTYGQFLTLVENALEYDSYIYFYEEEYGE